MSAEHRPLIAEIDLATIRHNVAVMTRLVAPSSVCAVVKANAYGHGSLDAAAAAIEGGASSVAVAIVDEGIELRRGGIEAPILVLTEPGAFDAGEAAAHGLTVTLYTEPGVVGLDQAARAAGRRVGVHVKLDTGMHRVGADRAAFDGVVKAVVGSRMLDLEGVFTHLAVADEPDDAFNDHQLDVFDEALAMLGELGHSELVVHAANSAAAIAIPRARYDLVRCGIATYGVLPDERLRAVFAGAANGAELRPALTLRASVHLVRELSAGERPSYGRRMPLARDARVATVLAGYADGIPRALGANGGAVLINGRRRPIAGTVTMDQIIVDCGSDGDVEPGDEVVLIGRQGDEEITAVEWADRTGTIPYEILCGIGPRVPRRVANAGT